jgi:hypothetical protein
MAACAVVVPAPNIDAPSDAAIGGQTFGQSACGVKAFHSFRTLRFYGIERTTTGVRIFLAQKRREEIGLLVHLP